LTGNVLLPALWAHFVRPNSLPANLSSLRSSKRRRISKLRGGAFYNDFGANEDFFVAYKPRLTLRTVVHSRHYIIDFASLKLFQGALFL
jgi:hypothetical protein